MRITADKQFDESAVSEGYRVSIPGGYERGIWNPDEEALFLLSRDGAVCTCIPDRDLDLSTEKFKKCQECGALVHEDTINNKCRFCGTDLQEISNNNGDSRSK